ncbi:hypothetical protein M569_17536, partial [Genlisea aurea]
RAQNGQAPPPGSGACNGIFISYEYSVGAILPPILRSDLANQAYRFQSSLFVLNNDLVELQSWQVFVGFQHRELLVSASNAILANGTSIPASVSGGAVFAGYPNSDLKTAIETAGDMTQMSVLVNLVGTEFGVAPAAVPMPANISLVNDGWLCPNPNNQGNGSMEVCCTRNPNFNSTLTSGDGFLPRQTGDLTIMYDVIRTYESNYWAQVTIQNYNPLGRLDNWQLTWDWMEGEFIYAMKGAYPSVVDTSECVFGLQGQFYQSLDFSNALSCHRRPTIVDLPLSKANNSDLGMIPFCCRNGTLLPPWMDPSKSRSAFQLQVYKMPPYLNRSLLSPPQNWAIQGTMDPDFTCGPPIRVSPSLFPDPTGNGLPESAAISSWQVVCNITKPSGSSPTCCVSFSAYFNESIVPCPTCACGCASTDRSCSAEAPAMLLPPQALLIPFDNRSALARAWAGLNHFPVPNPVPCGDNCGVSINWHLFTDYTNGWSARVTIFNWDEAAFPDWFAAVELDGAAAGFQAAYSFNASVMDGLRNNTLFMQGLQGLNYLVGETNGTAAQNLPVPGKQQSVISFTKKLTPGIDVAAGEGFPGKVFFNGGECALPSFIPS